jgi:hypothetical protein
VEAEDTANLAAGEVVPIPNPVEVRRIPSDELIAKATLFAEGKYIPLVGTVALDGIKELDVVLPVIVKPVVENVPIVAKEPLSKTCTRNVAF